MSPSTETAFELSPVQEFSPGLVFGIWEKMGGDVIVEGLVTS